MGTGRTFESAPGRGDGHEALGRSSSPDLKRLLPAVALATFYVALAPLLVVWELRATGLIQSSALSVLGVLVLSLLVSLAGSAWWKKRQGSDDVLFGDLLAWAWIRRWRLERRLDGARTLLAGTQDRELAPGGQAGLLQALAAALEAREPYTHGHSRRVARFSVLIAEQMGLPEEDRARVRTAAAVHDVGKIRVPRAVLNKSGKLTDEEFALIKRHAEYSARMVKRLGDEQITAIVRHHHERLDGTGYPDGLSGEDVPLGSRIIAVADTFDALTSRRPYRTAKSHQRAMDILANEAGTQLDPDAVRAFRSYYSGRRALTLWNGATLLPERLLSALGAGLHSGGAASATQLLTAAAASSLIGGTIVLSATPPPSSARHASARVATIASVGADAGLRSGSLISIPALITGGSSSSPRSSASPGARAPGSHGPTVDRPGDTTPTSGAPPGPGPGAGGSSAAAGGSGDGSPAVTPLPDVPAAGGRVAPKLPDANGLLPGSPPADGVVPGLPGGAPLPSLPSAGGLLPKGAAGLTDQPSLPGRVAP